MGGISPVRVEHGVERGYNPRFGGELVLVKRAPFGEIGFFCTNITHWERTPMRYSIRRSAISASRKSELKAQIAQVVEGVLHSITERATRFFGRRAESRRRAGL
jgi:hypothetical protein